MTSYRLGEMSGGFGETGYDQLLDLEKCLEGLAKLVMASYRLGEMFGGFGETGFLKIPPPSSSSLPPSLILNATC